MECLGPFAWMGLGACFSYLFNAATKEEFVTYGVHIFPAEDVDTPTTFSTAKDLRTPCHHHPPCPSHDEPNNSIYMHPSVKRDRDVGDWDNTLISRPTVSGSKYALAYPNLSQTE